MMTPAKQHSPKHPLKFDLTSTQAKVDPFPIFAAMRAEGEVIPVKLPLIGGIWVTTTHAATQAVMKDQGLFVLEGKNAGKSGVSGVPVRWMPRTLKILLNNMLAKDEPDHRRLRKLVDQAFSRASMSALRPRIETIAEGLLDDIERQAATGERIDLVDAYARRLPILVICELLGLPPEDHDMFSNWSGKLTTVTGLLSVFRALGPIKQLLAYLDRQIEAARATPRPGLISDLVRAEEDGDRLSHDELLAMVFVLLVAGYETTTNLIAGGVAALEANPDQRAWLMEDRADRMELAVEELCRFVSAVQGTKPRYVSRDVDFFGQTLKRGEIMMALPATANADPAVFEAPDRLDLSRFPNPHLAFSAGIHFCLGQQLARIETQVALDRLYGRFPALSVEQPGGLVYSDRIGMRSMLKLWVHTGREQVRQAA
ncbi:cytochrome P450 [bacterium]|nr:cytochrome P450 [bacterium]